MIYGKMFMARMLSVIDALGSMKIFKGNGPAFVQGQRSGWAQKTKKGAKHAKRQIGNSAVGLYSQAHGIHWRKA